ncbi:GPI-linked NAD(P)(+)--arginine ADP-ribosyltransferase 1 isoform 3-T3 [Glossophaga mutica]
MQTPVVISLLLVSMGLMEALQAQSHPITRRELFSQERPLDMAPTSFDDQYTGCAAAMTAALPELNRTEFQTNKVYADGWVLGSSRWQERQAWGPPPPPPPPGFRDEHGVALLAYTANSPLFKEFNAALREVGRTRTHYLQHFSFKTFHFLLTEALQLLGKAQRSPRCRQVFRGVQGLRFRPAGPGATVRLGGFASASLQNAAAQNFGDQHQQTVPGPHPHLPPVPGRAEHVQLRVHQRQAVQIQALPSGKLRLLGLTGPAPAPGGS